jgi:hypothetical protein
MNDNTYRRYKVVLLAVFVFGALSIGNRASQTGRFTQFDLRKTYSPDEHTGLSKPPNYVIDTWTGERTPTE